MSRADAATAAGIERQALRDAVLRYDAEGPEGVLDRPAPGPPSGAERGGTGASLRPGLPQPRSGDGRRERVGPSGSPPLDRGPLRQVPAPAETVAHSAARSEERRVGKECVSTCRS